jgi:hypothetical protein
MKYLLPHRFKKLGYILTPIGFLVWVLMQKGVFKFVLNSVFGTSTTNTYATINTVIAIISFFSFLLGFIFIGFSKEKIEDELAQKTRLESFQFASLLQICFIIIGFVIMVFSQEPHAEGLLYFFVCSILLYWLSFVLRFHYNLYFKFKK